MKENKNGIYERSLRGFYKMNMSFTLPDRHEKIFTLLARDHFEQPLYFKNINLFDSNKPNFNINKMFMRTRDSTSDYASILQDIYQMGDSMIIMERKDIEKKVPFFLQ